MPPNPKHAAQEPKSGEAEGRGSITRTVRILGGPEVLKRSIASTLDVHEAILKGIPGGALVYMVSHVKGMQPADVTRAVGVSLRTVQRRTKAPRIRLSQAQSGRTWKFAEILAKATEVFGSQADAEKWLAEPAMALDRRRPVDLLTSPAGVELVEQLLGRLQYGVYT